MATQGIDSLVSQKMDAYRSNPQALQQRYAQNQELLDLLALQRLKSEKDAAARQMQMQTAQQPNTVKQQLEREMLDRTKQDMVQQVGGVMQQRQQQQQKNMQNVAKQGAASPQQVGQMAQGIGALAKQINPNVAKMAAGGIVAFEKGGPVTKADIDAYRANLRKTNRRAAASMSDERIREILSDDSVGSMGYAPESKIARLRELGKDVPDYVDNKLADKWLAELETSAPAETEPTSVLDETATAMETQGVETAPVEDTMAAQDQAGEAPTGPLGQQTPPVVPVEKPAVVAATAAPAKAGLEAITAPEIDTSGVGTRGKQINEAFGLGSLPSAQDSMNSARDDAAKFLGRDEKASKFKELSGKLEALDTEYSDPKRQRDREISAFLRGTAGGGSFGQTMAGGSEAMAKEQDQQYKDRRQRLQDMIGIETAAIEMDFKIGQNAQQSGDAAANRADANRRQAADIMARMSQTEMQEAMKVAEMKLDADKSNLRAQVDQLQIESNEALKQALQSQADTQKDLAIFQDTVSRMGTISEKVMNDPEYLYMVDAALQEKDPEKRAELQALAQAKHEQLVFVTNAILDRAGLLDLEQILIDKLGYGGKYKSKYQSVGGGKLDAATEELLRKYGG